MNTWQQIGLLLSCVVSVIHASKHGPPPVNPLEKVGGEFYFQMAMTDVENNRTMQIYEYFDKANNRGVIDIRRSKDVKVHEILYYDYGSKECIIVMPDIGWCVVIPLNAGTLLLGRKLDKGQLPIFSGTFALRFMPKTPYTYVGMERIRGIMTKHWTSKVQENNTQGTVDWYFSADEWDGATMSPPVPVRCHVKGTTTLNNNQQKIEHYYEFYQFRKDLPEDTSIFETPPGIPCFGSKTTKLVPAVPKVMSQRLELFNETTKILTNIAESYDFDYELSMFRSDTPVIETDDEKPNVVINDFNVGLTYNIDTIKGDCSVKPISSILADAKKIDSQHIRMAKPEDFFGLQKGNYTYQGIRNIRNIECDVWIGISANKNLANYVTEFYFAKTKLLRNGQVLDGGLIAYAEYQVVKGKWTSKLFYNVFDFSQDQSNLEQFDVSLCYVNQQRVEFKLLIAAKDALLVMMNVKKSKLYMTAGLMYALNLTPLRIQNMQITALLDGLEVSFEILDVAPIKGDAAKINQVSLENATSTLEHRLKYKTLEIIVQSLDGITLQTIYPTQLGKVKRFEKELKNVFYSGKSMAALGICMTLIGGITAVLLVLRFKKY